MKRREFVALVGGALAAPLVWAQAPVKVRRIGFVQILARKGIEEFVQSFEAGLGEHGWVNGKNLAIEYRFADGKVERIPALARELEQLGVELIVTGTNPGTLAARGATAAVPIVAAVGTNVIGAGLAASLARPGGRVTGVTVDVGTDLYAKRLQLLKETAPKVSRVAVLLDPQYEGSPDARREIERAASVLGVSLVWPAVSDDVEGMFSAAIRDRANGAYLVGGARLYALGTRLVEFSARHRLPVVYHVSQMVEAGGLMSFAPSVNSAFRDAARYVDKILEGAKPGDLPMEQPTKFELAVNLKTAKALGLKIPQSVLLRASRVIE